MAKVTLSVSFRSYHQFSTDPREDQLALLKQRIDIANAGSLTVDEKLPHHFKYEMPCEVALENTDGIVGLNLVNDQLTVLVRHISAVVPDAVITASSGSLIPKTDPSMPTFSYHSGILFDTALALLCEGQKIMGLDEKDCSHVVLGDWTDWYQRVTDFLEKFENWR